MIKHKLTEIHIYLTQEEARATDSDFIFGIYAASLVDVLESVRDYYREIYPQEIKLEETKLLHKSYQQYDVCLVFDSIEEYMVYRMREEY